MVYKEQFVVAIQVDGKILRENKDTVAVPFGAEYSILLKNLNTVRAQVSVTVDGTPAVEGTILIVRPNSTLVLERYIRNGNLETGNRFKFIERTAAIEEHRGIKAEDGLVRVEFRFEKVLKEMPEAAGPHAFGSFDSIDSGPAPERGRGEIPSSGAPVRGGRPGISGAPLPGSGLHSAFPATVANEPNTTGITVPGSKSMQKFKSVPLFPTENESHAIVLRLIGEFGGVAIEKPITVDQKPQCSTCGKTNKAGSNFCSQCGTALLLF